MVIDGHGMAMFVNHSCDPNCEIEETKGRVYIDALRKIAAGEELTYDYSLYDGDDEDPAICTCGSQNCRGTMYSPEEVKKDSEPRSKLRSRQSRRPARTVTAERLRASRDSCRAGSPCQFRL